MMMINGKCYQQWQRWQWQWQQHVSQHRLSAYTATPYNDQPPIICHEDNSLMCQTEQTLHNVWAAIADVAQQQLPCLSFK